MLCKDLTHIRCSYGGKKETPDVDMHGVRHTDQPQRVDKSDLRMPSSLAAENMILIWTSQGFGEDGAKKKRKKKLEGGTRTHNYPQLGFRLKRRENARHDVISIDLQAPKYAIGKKKYCCFFLGMAKLMY